MTIPKIIVAVIAAAAMGGLVSCGQGNDLRAPQTHGTPSTAAPAKNDASVPWPNGAEILDITGLRDQHVAMLVKNNPTGHVSASVDGTKRYFLPLATFSASPFVITKALRPVPVVLDGVEVTPIGVLTAQGDEPSGLVWPAQRSYRMVTVATPPPMDGITSFDQGSWESAEVLGGLVSNGESEASGRKTLVRMLRCDGTVYVAVRCADPQPHAIVPGADDVNIWQDDSLQFFFTQQSSASFPYIQVEVNAGGFSCARKVVRQIGDNSAYATEALDAHELRVRTGLTSEGWWALVAIPARAYGVPESTCFGNVFRNRPKDASAYSWMDLRGGSANRLHHFGRIDVLEHALDPLPALELPSRLSVGANVLRFQRWQEGCTVRLDGVAVPVDQRGLGTAAIGERGTVSIELIDRQGTLIEAYSADVDRPLIIETTEPFLPATATGASLIARIDIAQAEPATVVFSASHGGNDVSRVEKQLASGIYRIEMPCPDVRGEITMTASMETRGASSRALPLTAHHTCLRGVERAQVDRFRDGIESLPLLSLYRAALADAGNYYRLLQTGDGVFRHMDQKGRFGTRDVGYCLTYPMALLYKAEWLENPYKGDQRFLSAAIAGMEAGLKPQGEFPLGGRPSRYLQAFLLTYDLLKNDLDPAVAAYWKRRLIEMVEAVMTIYMAPAADVYAFYSDCLGGTSTNHFSLYIADVYTAGKTFDRPEWIAYGRDMARRMAEHAHEGFFAERHGVPATHYSWVSMAGLGEYYFQSGDEEVLGSLLRCVAFACHSSIAPNQLLLLHDGRNNSYRHEVCGEFVLSLTAQGRALAHAMAKEQLSAIKKPSGGDWESWFRIAEAATYFRAGEEALLPETSELAFCDGRALIAASRGFLYGLSAIPTAPVADRFELDLQNAIEVHQRSFGAILCGANSQEQPDAGSFVQQIGGKTIFLPSEGAIQRTESGHMAQLSFDTFTVRIGFSVESESSAVLEVRLLSNEAKVPVIFNFFPATNNAANVSVSDDERRLEYGRIRLDASERVGLERDFKIVNPYSENRRVAVKSLRASVALDQARPFVLRISVKDAK
jgi:hypothetical protein